METRTDTLDEQIVTRYTSQPSRLPAELRRRLETAWDGPVVLYALADLDPSLRLAETWVALGTAEVAVARLRPEFPNIGAARSSWGSGPYVRVGWALDVRH